jgi:hypothetical protein
MYNVRDNYNSTLLLMFVCMYMYMYTCVWVRKGFYLVSEWQVLIKVVFSLKIGGFVDVAVESRRRSNGLLHRHPVRAVSE